MMNAFLALRSSRAGLVLMLPMSLMSLMSLMVLLASCSTMKYREGVAGARVPGIESSSEPLEAIELLPVSALRNDLVLRQRVTIRWRGGEESFEAVLQKRGSELLLLGLGPMSVIGFSLRVDEDGVHFENKSGRDLPFAPKRIIADIQRVFYPWIEPGAECRDCERRGVWGQVQVIERIGSEALEERRFERVGVEGGWQIVIGYHDWIRDTSIPGLATLRNDALGYRLIVETKSVELIDAQ